MATNGTSAEPHALTVSTSSDVDAFRNLTTAVGAMGQQLRAVTNQLRRAEGSTPAPDDDYRRLKDTVDTMARQLGAMLELLLQQQAMIASLAQQSEATTEESQNAPIREAGPQQAVPPEPEPSTPAPTGWPDDDDDQNSGWQRLRARYGLPPSQ